MLFRSLSYFRDHEDNNVRSDKNEGNSVYGPTAGLTVKNLTRNTTFTLEGFSFVSAVKQDEIFVYCLSRSFTPRLWDEFGTVAGVEILDPGAFCGRVEEALPANAVFPGPP